MTITLTTNDVKSTINIIMKHANRKGTAEGYREALYRLCGIQVLLVGTQEKELIDIINVRLMFLKKLVKEAKR